MTAEINGLPILDCEIRMPRTGPWLCRDLQIDALEPVAGAVTLVIDGVTFKATVVESGADGGRNRAELVGGAGGLETQLDAKQYKQGPRVQQVLADIMSRSGETLSSTIESSLLDGKLPSWQRAKGTARQAVQDLVDKLEVNWRVLRDGTIWIGTDAYTATEINHEVIEERWEFGAIEVAPRAPDLLPGVTFRGKQINEVIHRISGRTLRTTAYLKSLADILSDGNRATTQRIRYSRHYDCVVSKQNSDGTLELVPDDPIMKGRGLDRVPIRHGFPGVTRVNVSSGARLQLGFAGGDPSKPYACNWEDGAVDSIEFGGSAASEVARKGDAVEVLLPPMVLIGTFIAPQISPSPVPITATVSATLPKALGTITVGSTKLKVSS